VTAVGEDAREAFERLCRDEYAAILRAAYLITGDRQEALDVAQETFARAYQHWRTVSRLDRPAAWLQRVATNVALSWLRRRQVRGRVRAVPPPQYEAEAGSFEPAGHLSRALATLSPGQRAVVVLRYYLDRSVEETATALGKRPGTVRALTSQALARLRETLPKDTFQDG
jgi:RNA polymerase sigma-70 factor (sigma-E family)